MAHNPNEGKGRSSKPEETEKSEIALIGLEGKEDAELDRVNMFLDTPSIPQGLGGPGTRPVRQVGQTYSGTVKIKTVNMQIGGSGFKFDSAEPSQPITDTAASSTISTPNPESISRPSLATKARTDALVLVDNPLIESGLQNGGKGQGMVLIVPLITYWNKMNSAWVSRKGAQEDIAALKGTCGRFGMRIFCPQNVTECVRKEQISRWLEDFKETFCNFENKDRPPYCIIVIMGHGQKGDVLLDSLGSEMSIDKEIFDQFNNHNFRAMAGSPKLFIMQCCRGTQPVRMFRNKMDSQCFEDSEVFEPEAVDSRPFILAGISDSLVIWSTVKGSYSYRNEILGSYFIQEFCKILNEYADVLRIDPVYAKDFSELLLKLKKKFRDFQVNMGRMKNEDGEENPDPFYAQPPQIVDTLFHRFILHLNGKGEYRLV